MNIKGLESIVAKHALFAGLGDDFLDLVTGCAKNVRFQAGEFMAREGEKANEIYLIREGEAALEISAPGHGRMTFQSVGPNGVIGLSWLVPPYLWTYDARAHDELRAISIDATCLRNKCDADPALGYAVMQRFMPILVERLHNTRLQMLDVYGPHS